MMIYKFVSLHAKFYVLSNINVTSFDLYKVYTWSKTLKTKNILQIIFGSDLSFKLMFVAPLEYWLYGCLHLETRFENNIDATII